MKEEVLQTKLGSCEPLEGGPSGTVAPLWRHIAVAGWWPALFEVLTQGQPSQTRVHASLGLGGPSTRDPAWGFSRRKGWSGRALQRQEVEPSRIPRFPPGKPSPACWGSHPCITAPGLRTPARKGLTPSAHPCAHHGFAGREGAVGVSQAELRFLA